MRRPSHPWPPVALVGSGTGDHPPGRLLPLCLRLLAALTLCLFSAFMLPVDQLRAVMAACPSLSHLRVHGLSEGQAAALATAWQTAQAARGRVGHRVDAGPGEGLLLSLSQE